MSMTDPIADFLTRIRNGIQAAHEEVVLPSSTTKVEIARILRDQGYIASWAIQPAAESGKPFDQLVVGLKYTDARVSVISGIKRESRPGQRYYVDATSIPKVLGGMGTAIVSTSQGVMTGHEARQRGIGGEVMASVW